MYFQKLFSPLQKQKKVMDLKKILNEKTELKEKLATHVLKSGIFDAILKTNRHSAQQIVIIKLEEKIYSMNENELLEYFDTTENIATIMPKMHWFTKNKEVQHKQCFTFLIEKKGVLYFECKELLTTRKDATIKCVEKLIELSN